MSHNVTQMVLTDSGAYLISDINVTGDFLYQKITANVVRPSPDLGKAWPGGKPKRKTYGIERVIFNYPATIVYWADGTKTVVKCQPGDVYSKETGLALCIAKKFLGNKGNFNDVFKQWIPEEISVDEMRNSLDKFCDGKNCSGCPLEDPVCRCGLGTHFLIKKDYESYDMSDDEIRAAYKIAFKKEV